MQTLNSAVEAQFYICWCFHHGTGLVNVAQCLGSHNLIKGLMKTLKQLIKSILCGKINAKPDQVIAAEL